MTANTVAAALIAAVLATGCAAVGANVSADRASQRYVLKDGNVLYVDADGRMRMFAPDGDRVYMKDGVPMELKDGTLITMKENAIWKALRTRGTLNPRS